jgi:AMP nucleosidase
MGSLAGADAGTASPLTPAACKTDRPSPKPGAAAAAWLRWHDDRVVLSTDFSAVPDRQRTAEVERLCDAMEAIYAAGHYPELMVERPWSAANPVLEGEFASPGAIRWYLERELGRLAVAGARISVGPGREVLDLHDPALAAAIDETRWDLRRKKLFLFGPERMALSIDRLEHYTGTSAERFQRYVLLTNYAWHLEEFRAARPDSTGPDSDGRQMPAWHYELPGRAGITMVNIGVGPSNAKTLTDHLAVLRPDLVLMIGHCAGLRNHQDIGDLVLASAYVRDDHVLDDMLPLSVPVVSNYTLNTLLLSELTSRRLRSRLGIVFTTANRNWDLRLALVEEQLRSSRALAVDMESATVAANGFRYRIPTATLLAVSDKPLHARPKLSADAQSFYSASRRQHVEIAIAVAEKVRRLYPGGLPTAGLRSPDEPLLGVTGREASATPGDRTVE